METVVKLDLDRILLALLGHYRYVEMWWVSPNKAFDGECPLTVYQSNEENRQKVIKYVFNSVDGMGK